MDPGELQDLFEVEPGVESCLYNHEWYTHGTCSGMDVADFFEISTDLALEFQALPNFQALIADSAGSTVSRAQLIAALALDLGSTAEDAVVIQCRKDHGTEKAYFSEVDLTLDRDWFFLFPDAMSLGTSEPWVRPDGSVTKDLGNCPVEGIVISP